MTWQEAVIAVKSWYERNIHDYNQSAFTICSGIPGVGSCRHDCSGFVSACLRAAGMFPANYTTNSRAIMPNGYDADKLRKAGFVAIPWNISSAQPFDIFVLAGHTEIYAGGRRSYNWGSCHDLSRGGMPSGTSHLNQGYYVMWRHPSVDPNNIPADIDFSGMDGANGAFGGGIITDLSQLTGEALDAQCPDNIQMRGLWARYQLQMNDRSPALNSMGVFVPDAGATYGDGASWDGSMAELSGSDAVEKAMQLMAREECGQDFNAPLPQKMLVGYQLKGEGHKTYGFGQMYNWNGTRLMEQIKPVWTEAELREEFRKQATREISQAKSIGLPFTDNQLAVLAHRYHFGPKAFQDLKRRMQAHGGVPDANGYREMALAFCRSCKNWNIYGKGWTNGINREASYWNT